MPACSPVSFRDPLLTTEMMPAGGLGGPIVQNRMFFYASARHSRETKWDRFNKVGTPLPDEVRTGPEFFGKLTFAAAAQHQLTGSYRHRPNHVENAGTGADFAPSVASRTDNGSGIATAEWANFIGRAAVGERAISLHEREERGRADHGSGIPADVRSPQPVGDGAIHRSLAGEPDRGWRRVHERSELPAARGARHFHPVFRHRQNEPHAEGRLRVRIRGGAIQPHRQRVGRRSSTSRRAACRHCARVTTRRNRRSAG